DGRRGAQRSHRRSRSVDRGRTHPRAPRPRGDGSVRVIRELPAVLTRARVETEPALRQAVGRLHAQLQVPLRYHFGWTDADGRPVDGGGGKGLRPALAVLSAEAAGAPAAIGVPGAVAVEL